MRRRGFTVLEILLVLGFLVLVLSLSWPAIDSFRTEYQLRQGGQLVQTRLSAARVHAVEAGQPYQFRFEPNGQRFVVLPFDHQLLVATQVQGHRPKKAAGVLPSDAAHFDVTSTGGTGGQPFPAEWLNGIADAGNFSSAAWSAPIIFYPDGTATAATLVIRDKKSRQVTISVRPLTGSVTVSKVVRGAQ